MGNWLEEELGKLRQVEVESHQRWSERVAEQALQRKKEEEEDARRRQVAIEQHRKILNAELEKVQPQNLLADVRDTSWKTGQIIYGESLDESGGIVAYGLVFEYQAMFDFGTSESVDMGDRTIWNNQRSEVLPAYECIVIGAHRKKGGEVTFYVSSYSTEYFNVRVGRDEDPISLSNIQIFAKKAFAPRINPYGAYAQSSQEIMKLLAIDCKRRTDSGKLPLQVEREKAVANKSQKPIGFLGLFKR